MLLGLHSAEHLCFGPVKHISIFNFKHKNNHVYCACIVHNSMWSPANPFLPVETHSVGHHTSWSSNNLDQRNLLESQMLSCGLCISVSLQRKQGTTLAFNPDMHSEVFWLKQMLGKSAVCTSDNVHTIAWHIYNIKKFHNHLQHGFLLNYTRIGVLFWLGKAITEIVPAAIWHILTKVTQLFLQRPTEKEQQQKSPSHDVTTKTPR